MRGQAVDARADLFAFGAVLYEMLAGRRAFQGESAADTISAILGKDPPNLVSAPDHLIPPALQRIVARCLEKDPAARFQSAADLAFALQALTSDSTSSGTGVVPVPPAPARRAWREWVLAALALAGVGAAAVSRWDRPAPAASLATVVAQFDVDSPFGVGGEARASLSPDGRWLLLYGSSQHVLRSMVDGTTVQVSKEPSRGASAWAPDSSSFTYLAGNQLVVHRLADRSTRALADVGALVAPVTAAWSSSNELVIADAAGRVLALSGVNPTSTPRVIREAGTGRLLAGFLPGTSMYLSVAEAGPPEAVGLFVSTLDGGMDRRIDANAWQSGVVVDATTVLLKQGTAIFEQRLTPGAVRTDGEARLLTTGTAASSLSWSASANGVLVHLTLTPSRFQWFDRAGRPGGEVGAASLWTTFDMDADGRRVVAARLAPGGSVAQSLWTIDTARAVEDRLTFTSQRESDPALSGDGRRTAFVSGVNTNSTITAYATGPGQPSERLFDDPAGVALDDWSPDGRWIVYHQRGLPGAQTGLFIRGVTPADAQRRLAKCEGIADEARVAPNGAWLAFNCSESGRHEIYVLPFPEGGERVRISRDGGVQPAWRGDSAELYFLSPDSVMMAAAVDTRAGFVAAPPQVLFKTALVATAQLALYRVTADGQRFLLLRPDAAAAGARVFINWRERFKAEPSAGR